MCESWLETAAAILSPVYSSGEPSVCFVYGHVCGDVICFNIAGTEVGGIKELIRDRRIFLCRLLLKVSGWA